MTPLERSTVYAGLAAAFRTPDGGTDVLDPALIPQPPDDRGKSFMEAFEPSVSKAAVSLHASSHVEREQTDLYQEMIRWYAHFGLKRKDGGELPDHVSVMLGFMQFLTAQEHANSSDEEVLGNLHKAQADFLARHLLPLAEALVAKTQSSQPRYRALPVALTSFVREEIASLT